eukprot:Platyproteum_vivax@DN5090_c0_g1_i1.p1
MSRFMCAVDPLWSRLNVVEKIAKNTMKPMTLQRLWRTNSTNQAALIKTAEWVRVELAVRLAHRLADFHRIPYIATKNPELQAVYQLYLETFEELHDFPGVTNEDIKKEFVEKLRKIYMKHGDVVHAVGRGIRQMKVNFPEMSLDHFLEKFFYSRIARRIMIDHLIQLHQNLGVWVLPYINLCVVIHMLNFKYVCVW